MLQFAAHLEAWEVAQCLSHTWTHGALGKRPKDGSALEVVQVLADASCPALNEMTRDPISGRRLPGRSARIGGGRRAVPRCTTPLAPTVHRLDVVYALAR
jgi:hypothetical protein